jgi:hypothetical protein
MEVIDKMITRIIEINNELNDCDGDVNLMNERYELIGAIEIMEKYDEKLSLPSSWQMLGLKFSTLANVIQEI